VVNRGGAQTVLQVTPDVVEVSGPVGKQRKPVLGIKRIPAANEPGTETVDPLTAVGLGAEKTWFVVDTTLTYLGKVLVGRESPDQIGGVVGIAQISGKVANFGFLPVLDLAGMLSVSIGLLNLFPIPLLDGGHLLFYAFEGLRGKPLSERAQELGFRFGLAVVLFLMIFATYNDLSRVLWPWS
jgi:regulator of sigma E protease